MGDVNLPDLVRQVGDETAPARPRAFVRLREDKPAPGQHPPDRRHGRGGQATLAQVPGDGLRAGVVPGLDQLLAQPDDSVLNLGTDVSRIAAWAARARLERRLTLNPVAGDQLLHPAPRQAVLASNLAPRP